MQLKLPFDTLGGGWLAAVMLAGSLLANKPALATLPTQTFGTWAITETRAGNKCTATLLLQPVRLAQSAEDLQRGAAQYQGVCVDSASGSWVVQDGDPTPRLAWRLEYEKSTVFFSSSISQDASGALIGKGDVYASPRGDPSNLRRVGNFVSKRVSGEWDLRNPVVSRQITDKIL